METTPLSEIFEHVPVDAKTVIFIVRYGDNISNFIDNVTDELTDDTKKIQRAQLIFGKGIPEEYAKRIVVRISENIKTKDGGMEDLHLHGISGVSDAKIKQYVRHYKRKGIVQSGRY